MKILVLLVVFAVFVVVLVSNRMILRRAMLAHGFSPLDTEWWHFTLKDEPFPDTYFTFPVKQLKRQSK